MDGLKAKPEDLARAVLVTTANNIGSIALNAATQYGIERIVYTGKYINFLTFI